MTNLLGASNVGSIVALVVLMIIAVLYLGMNISNRKKQQEQAIKMMNELKKGDKVVISAGIYGEIVAIRETNMGKVVTLKTGDEESKKFGYISVNAQAILGIDTKEDLILDAEGNVIEPKEELKEEVLKENFKEEEKTEEEPKEEKKEEKPKKKTAKKSSKKTNPEPVNA
ncbi:MAG: preprotein translocase subunit YajC [Clostridia bacterium]|nr:preprotein translocase subunit YajC [Clostridia bacterium]